MISPYDLTLNRMGVKDRRQWAEHVLPEIVRRTSLDEELTFLTGTRYHEFLVPPLRDTDYVTHIPMEGLRFGGKLQWLQQHNTGDLNE